MTKGKPTRVRRHERIAADYEYFMVCEGHKYTGHTKEISPYGSGVFSENPIEPGSDIEFTIYIPESSFKLMVKGVVRSCNENQDVSDESRRYIIGIEFTESISDELPLIVSKDQTTRITPSHTITIKSPAKRCYELSYDFEHFSEWSSGLEELRVIERYPDGRGRRVEFVYNFHLRKARYTLEYTYDDSNNTMSWVKAGGDKDLTSITGSFVFTARDENLTSATYSVELDISFIPSNKLINWGTAILMRMELRNFKKFVENYKE